MNQLKTLASKSGTTFFIFFCILAVYGLCCHERRSAYSTWLESRSSYVVEHVTAMTTTDAYYWLKMAGDLDADKLGIEGVIDPLKGYPDITEYTADPSLLAHLISLAARFTDGNHYRAGILLATVLAGLFVFPLFLYFHHLGFGAAAILGGLIGSFSVAYHARSNHGYVDTDILNLFFPLAVSALIVRIDPERDLRSNLALAGGAGAFMFLFSWWYQQPLFFLVYLFFIAAYLLVMRIPCKQIVALLGVYALLSGPGYVLQSLASLHNFLNAYFFPQPSGRVAWPDILATVTEAAHSDLLAKLKRIHGLVPFTLAGLAGLGYLGIVKWKKMIPVAPLVLLGIWSLFGPRRFAMYLTPFIGVGVGVLILLAVQQATRKFGGGKLATNAAAITLMAVLFFSTIGATAYGIVPGAMPSRETIQAFLDIKKVVPKNSAMFTWWDYGYALMEIGELATYNDGQLHAGIRSTLTAKSFTSPRQENLVSLLAFLEECGFQELHAKIVRENLTGEEMMRLVFSHPPAFAGKNVYVLFTEDMMRNFGGISFMGNWDFSSRASSPMQYAFLNCSPLPGDVLACREGRVDLGRGLIYDDSHSLSLKSALIVRDGEVVRRIDYPAADGDYLQILMQGDRIFMVQVLEERLFQSNFNQLFILGNYDRRYFEETFNRFPVARAFRIRAATESAAGE